jgi:DnaJ homologue, subfamily C, member 28, conserved domain
VTERKPPGVSWESWIDKQIREGAERGLFDDLPGAGKPLPDLDGPRDEDRWIKKKLQAEGVSYLPTTLKVRKDLEDAIVAIGRARSEEEVRRIAEEINAEIRTVNRLASSGPPSNLMPLDVDDVVARWHAART